MRECLCVFACVRLRPQEKKVRNPGPVSSRALWFVSPRVYQLIKEPSAPIKGPIKKQGGEAHLDGGAEPDS